MPTRGDPSPRPTGAEIAQPGEGSADAIIPQCNALNRMSDAQPKFFARHSSHRTASYMNDQRIADTFGFFLAWLRNPLRVAAIAPSGQALARIMTSELSPDTGPVIELGPGTGVFTRALIARGVRQENLALVEFDPSFAARLQIRYPNAQVLRMDAARLRTVEIFSGQPVGAVVSGLPLLSMSTRKVMAVLSGAFCKMRPSGAFYQFTYGPRSPVPPKLLDFLGLEAERIGGTILNLPPAAVYRISRKQPTTDNLSD